MWKEYCLCCLGIRGFNIAHNLISLLSQCSCTTGNEAESFLTELVSDEFCICSWTSELLECGAWKDTLAKNSYKWRESSILVLKAVCITPMQICKAEKPTVSLGYEKCPECLRQKIQTGNAGEDIWSQITVGFSWPVGQCQLRIWVHIVH